MVTGKPRFIWMPQWVCILEWRPKLLNTLKTAMINRASMFILTLPQTDSLPYRSPELHKVSFASQRQSGYFSFHQSRWKIFLAYSWSWRILEIFCVWNLIQEPLHHIAPVSVRSELFLNSPIHPLRLLRKKAPAILCWSPAGLPLPFQPSFSIVLYQSALYNQIYTVIPIP